MTVPIPTVGTDPTPTHLAMIGRQCHDAFHIASLKHSSKNVLKSGDGAPLIGHPSDQDLRRRVIEENFLSTPFLGPEIHRLGMTDSGSTGADVAGLQEALVQLGFLGSGEFMAGRFDNATDVAVRRLQWYAGNAPGALAAGSYVRRTGTHLIVDGIAGPQVKQFIKSFLDHGLKASGFLVRIDFDDLSHTNPNSGFAALIAGSKTTGICLRTSISKSALRNRNLGAFIIILTSCNIVSRRPIQVPFRGRRNVVASRWHAAIAVIRAILLLIAVLLWPLGISMAAPPRTPICDAIQGCLRSERVCIVLKLPSSHRDEFIESELMGDFESSVESLMNRRGNVTYSVVGQDLSTFFPGAGMQKGDGEQVLFFSKGGRALLGSEAFVDDLAPVMEYFVTREKSPAINRLQAIHLEVVSRDCQDKSLEAK